MLGWQLKERILKRRICRICKNRYHNSVFQSSENFNFENVYLGSTMVGLIEDSSYQRMSSTLFVNSGLRMIRMILL